MRNQFVSTRLQQLLATFFVVLCAVRQMKGQNAGPPVLPDDYQDRITKEVQAMNVPIAFYGLVVDQNGNPLSGAKVSLSVQQPFYDPIYLIRDHIARFERVTSADGRFSLDNNSGKNVEIEAMIEAGYEAEPNVKRVYAPTSGTLNKPMVFKMWRDDTKQSLVSGSQSVRIKTDGTPYAVDFAKNAISQSPELEGDLRILVNIPPKPMERGILDWSFQIDVPDGGLCEESDDTSSLFLAPSEGYTNRFFIDHKANAGLPPQNGTLQFYVRLRNGAEYGRFSIDLASCINIPSILRVQHVINPSGSRILR